MGVEPVEQLHVHPKPPEGKLRRMEMEVDESRDDEPVSKVLHRHGGIRRRKRRKDTLTPPILANQIVMFQNPKMIPVNAVTNMSLEHKGVHRNLLLSAPSNNRIDFMSQL